MNCRKAKDLLLTDALDRELGDKVKDQLSAHLTGCADCRQLQKDIESDLSTLFRPAAEPKVPESLWRQIERKIEKEETLPFWRRSLRDLSFKLKEAMVGVRLMLPRPAIGVSAALVALMAVFFMVRPITYSGAFVYLSEQAGYMDTLGSADLSGEQADTSGWDMPEEIFL